jgi:hypothetical protein
MSERGDANAWTVRNTFRTTSSATRANKETTSMCDGTRRGPTPLLLFPPLFRQVKNTTTRIHSKPALMDSCRKRLAFNSARAELMDDRFASGLKYVEHPWAVQEMMALVKTQTTTYDIVWFNQGSNSLLTGEQSRNV